MHIKRAYFAGVHDGEPLHRIVRPGEMIKTAGLSPKAASVIDTLRPDPKYTFVLSNAMGNSKFFGSNSNTDWYGHNPHLDFDGLTHAWEGIGQDVESDRERGKNWPFGYPCFYGATIYAHHKNTDPALYGFGDVLFAGYNDAMQRVELVLRVNNDEAQRKGHSTILDRIRRCERVDTSMGCRVPFDLCSICTDWDEVKKAWKTFDPKKHAHPGVAILQYHRKTKPIRGLAVTKLDYCEDMQQRRGQVLPDGRKVYVYNDFPRFYDESFVWIGADRTARVMWFLQDSSSPPPAARPVTGRPSLEALLESLRSKFSSMDKEIPGSMVEASMRESDSAVEMLEPNIVPGGSVGDLRETLSSLAALGVVATPGEFQNLVLEPKAASALQKLGHVFDDRVSGVDDTYAVSAELVSDKLAYAYAPFMGERSSFAPFLAARLDRPARKVASRRSVPYPRFFEKLAQMYNGYRLSILEQAPALFRKGASQLSTDQLLAADGGDLAGFLLGPGPMVQLISSHLQRSDAEGAKIAAMANKIASTTTFEKVSHLGTALRGIVRLDNGPGLVEALAALGAQAGKTG